MGVSGLREFGLDQLFYDYGVDFYFCGHVHNYERMYDIYDNKTTKSTVNMPATTYVISGSAGCDEGGQAFDNAPYPWDAYRANVYSYTGFYVCNSTY